MYIIQSWVHQGFHRRGLLIRNAPDECGSQYTYAALLFSLIVMTQGLFYLQCVTARSKLSKNFFWPCCYTVLLHIAVVLCATVLTLFTLCSSCIIANVHLVGSIWLYALHVACSDWVDAMIKPATVTTRKGVE